MAFYIKSTEWFGKDVCSHLFCWTEVYFNLLPLDLLANPMHFDVDVFHFAMVFRVSKDF